MRLTLLVKVILLLSLAAGLGFLMRQDSGLMVLSWSGYSLSTSLWLGLLMAMLLYGLIRLLLNLMASQQWFSRLGRRFNRRQQRQAEAQTEQGILELLNDQHPVALKRLLKSATHSPLPWLNWLLAAYCARHIPEHEHALALLERAQNQYPRLEVLFALQQIEILKEDAQAERALAVAKKLHAAHPNNGLLLKQLLSLHLALGDHNAALAMIPQLLASQGRSKELLLRKLFSILVAGEFALPANSLHPHQVTALRGLWSKFSKEQKQDPVMVEGLAIALGSQGLTDESLQVLREGLKLHWHSPLVRRYGLLPGNPDKQHKQLTQWHELHASDVQLQLALARVLMRQQLWGQCLQHLERAQSLAQLVEIDAEMYRLAERMQDPRLLQQQRQRLLEQQLANLPALAG